LDQIEPNPRDATILAGAVLAKKAGAGAIVALGGGSPIDAAKAIAVMAANEGPLADYCGAGADPWPVPPMPIVAIPTTAGTGAEVSGAAMINLVTESRKADIFGQSIRPVTAILDPVLTVGLPPHLTASTGVDALSHAVEAYVALYANPVTDALAEKAIQLVAENLRLAYVDGGNLEARGNMLLASAMAVMAAGAGLGVVHSLAQTIGGFYDAPHGLSIAVCFPLGMRYNLFAVPEKFARIAELLGADVAEPGTIAAAKRAVPALQGILDDLDIVADMRSLGVREADIPRLAELAMIDGCTPTNPRPIDEAGLAALFAQGLE
jgi:alcohol dehydrogenase class IV